MIKIIQQINSCIVMIKTLKKVGNNFWIAVKSEKWALFVSLIFILVFIVIIPRFLNDILLHEQQWDIVGDEKTWLSFWGSYISGIATFVVVGITLITTKDLKKKQTEVYLYTQENACLSQLKASVSELYMLFNFQKLMLIINQFAVNLMETNQKLLELNSDVEMISFKSELSTMHLWEDDKYTDQQKQIINHFDQIVNKLVVNYGGFVNELLFINRLYVQLRTHQIASLSQLKQLAQEAIDLYKGDAVNLEYAQSDNSIYSKVIMIDDSISLWTDEVSNLCNTHINNIVQIHIMKSELISASKALLAMETERVNSILT